MRYKFLIIVVINVFFVGLTSYVFASSDNKAKKRIAVIQSLQIEQYKTTYLSFQNSLINKQYNIEFKEFLLPKASSGDLPSFINEVNSFNADLIYVQGTEAALFVKNNFPQKECIFSMVLNPAEVGVISSQPAKISGVSLNIPFDKQFELLKKILPEVKSVGMIFDAKNRPWLKEAAQVAADKVGLQLNAYPIFDPKDLKSELNKAVMKSDCLWATVDPKIYNPNTVQVILLETLRQKKPFMAFSFNYVKAGALIGVECDYEKIGSRSAELAIKVFGGTPVSDLEYLNSDDYVYSVNKKIADILKINISAEVYQNSAQVVK